MIKINESQLWIGVLMRLDNLRLLAFVLGLCLAHPVVAEDFARALKQADALRAEGDHAAAYAEYLRQAKDNNNPLAQFNLALSRQNGWGVPVDLDLACDWYGMAAENGVPAASHYYGECLEQGIGRPKDPAAAAKWYQTAAELGHFYSYCSLGKLLMTGQGVARQPQKAIESCHSAAERGSPQAMFDLAVMLLEGDAAVRNPGQALHWFEQAIQAGVTEAAIYLARQFEQGLGTARDMASAAAWYEYAAAKGDAGVYLKTGAAYWQSPVDPETQLLPAQTLAKAYLWLSAAHRAAPEAVDRAKAGDLLAKVEAVMPATWKADLDAKVNAHLAAQTAMQ